MSRYPSYPAYRPSGVDWLGNVPAHWEVERLRFVAPESRDRLDTKPSDQPYLGLENIESKTGRLLVDVPTEEVASTVVSFRVGDVLFGKLRPYLAKVVQVDFAGVGTTELLVLRPRAGVYGRFLFYYLLTEGFIASITALTYGTKMPRANSEQVGNMRICLPSYSEQRAIADFLDRETARIDALIAKKQRLIQLLQEKRTALISHAVTKGLDAGVAMKESGVPWLGQVPAHWKAARLRFVAKIQTGLTLGQKYEDQILVTRPYLRVANVQDGFLDLADITEIEVPMYKAERHELRPGDVLMTEGGDFDKLGRGYVWDGQISGCLHQNHVFAVRPLMSLLDPHFLAALMTSAHGKHYFTSTSQQTTNLATTNVSKLKQFPLFLPPIAEQRQMLSSIHRQTDRLETLIRHVEDASRKLQEYRTALISAAVIGKIDVREKAAS